MILIVDMNCKKDSLAFDEFVLPIASIIKNDYEIKHHSEIKSVEKYSKMILSGTALKDNEYLKHIKKFGWIKNCDKPVLGICAGMEIIAIDFGSKLEKSKEIGMTDITTIKENKLFKGKFEAYELHNYAVVPSKKLEIIAKSANCVQAIKHREKEIYGVMSHPEVRNKEIIERFIKK